MNRWVTRLLTCCLVVLLFGTIMAAETQDYLDAFVVQVKPEKRAQFDAISKRIAEANRGNNGDQWIAMETMYGEGNVVTFISTRKGYGDIEKAMGAFMGAMSKAYGQAGTQKMFEEFSSCLVGSRSEVRLRRWDLSSNVPSDKDLSKIVGNGRYLRTTMVRVRPGRIADFEALAKETKAAREKNAPDEIVLFSQAVAGQDGTVFYVTQIKPSLAAFDDVPMTSKLLGEEGYQKWLKTNAEIVETTRTVINRYLPDLSNVPTQVASVAPDFWSPKPAVAAGKQAPKGKKATEAARNEPN